MRHFAIAAVILFVGCGPLAVDFTVGWGSNQSIKKTLDMNQRQTKAQTESQVDIVDAILDAVKMAEPTPTPTMPKITSITIETEQPPAPMLPTPTPKPVKKKITAKISPCTRWVCADTIVENCVCK